MYGFFPGSALARAVGALWTPQPDATTDCKHVLLVLSGAELLNLRDILAGGKS